ncbi:MAG: alpha-amylase family glycosyl hydrolase, partial [Chthoniobacteraceae bacterium]
LLPIADFAGGRNWGYDGVCLFAPSRAYGHPDDLRAFVDAAHRLGLSVILDVVYNHFGPDGNYLHAYIGDYLDESEKTPWGGAIRYAHPDFRPLRELVAANPGYWMREFHIDGFRLDATHAIFDDSPRHILQELTAAIHARGGYAIAEDARNEARLITPEAEGGLGFDAVWADDFHHIIRVANTREAEGYLADFDGTVEEAVDTLRHGWYYRGQHSKSEGKSRGTDGRHLPPERFVHCVSNHDQTGNHAFGERLSHRILPTARRAAEALFCLSPYTPMLFMGQEWAASTPFLFFTDHTPELGKLIVAGRREEFRHFAAFRAPEVLEKLPNPQAPRTFGASKLVWEERLRGAHAQALELYKTCLALRAGDAAFRPVSRDSWQVEVLASGIGVLRLHSTGGDWMVLFDLHGDHETSLANEPFFQLERGTWEVVLWTNETRFGGDGQCAVDPVILRATFATPETVVLRARSEL